MSPSLKDIAKRTGFSASTVSRALNGSELVNSETCAIVLEAIKELGYRPSHVARSLRLQRTGALGVILPKAESNFFSRLLAGIDAIAAEKQYYLMTAFSHSGRTEEDLLSAMLHEGRVDAVIFSNMAVSDETIHQAVEAPSPLVMIGRPVSGVSIPTIVVDNVGGAELGMAHLLDHGHKTIAVITGDESNYDSRQRLAGCRDAAKRAGIELPDELILRGQFTEESGHEAMVKWLDANGAPPEAVFSLNDDMAVGALKAISQRGYRVPNDVALMGFDDTDAARYTDLTTIKIPMQEIGRAAANVAILEVSGHKVNIHEPMETELVVRRSCGCVGATTDAPVV